MPIITFLPYITIVLTVIAVLIVLSSSKFKGWVGEQRVKAIIWKTKQCERYVLNNLIIKINSEKTSQIDHVLINHRGVFVIETKNYSGRIYGNEKQLEWTQVLNYGKVKNKLYNPIKQNKTHIYHISNILSENLPIISAVVFVKGNTHFINAKGVYSLRGLKRLIRHGNDCLTVEQMSRAYDELCAANDHSIRNSDHAKNINLMKVGIENNICPRCGKQLVHRHGSNGDFMGCKGYPSCRFTKKI